MANETNEQTLDFQFSDDHSDRDTDADNEDWDSPSSETGPLSNETTD